MIPRAAAWLLCRMLPVDVRASVLRDLEEMVETERTRRGRFTGSIWMWRQVLSFCVRFALERAREGLGPGTARERRWSVLDLRYAARTLLRAPILTLAAVLCLAVGIALPVAAFSVLKALFLQPLPFPEGERVVRLRDVHGRRSYDLDLTAAEYEASARAPDILRGAGPRTISRVSMSCWVMRHRD